MFGLKTEHQLADVFDHHSGADITEVVGKHNWYKGIKVIVVDDNNVGIECNIVIQYGQNVVAIAGAVQKAVSDAVEAMTGVKVASVNVNICEISSR